MTDFFRSIMRNESVFTLLAVQSPAIDPKDLCRFVLATSGLFQHDLDIASLSCSRVGKSPVAPVKNCSGLAVSGVGMSDSSTSCPVQRTVARSITFSSSRTVPSQRILLSFAIARLVNPTTFTLLVAAYLRKKCSAKGGISSGRLRKGGMTIGMTLRRYTSLRGTCRL